MCSREREVEAEVPDRQLSLLFGDSVVEPQAPRVPPEDAEPQELPECSLTETLNVSESMMKNNTLKYLYLKGNQISSIPDSLFINLPDILWLDLRNNQIASLPAKIGTHRSLKTLLMEGNPISELPAELGHVITLRGLNLRGCPIAFPPPDVVRRGLQSILQYLRGAMAERPVLTRRTPREAPVVEQLRLSELTGSGLGEPEEPADENDLQRFRELKQKMILLDKEELDLIAKSDRNPKSRLHPVITRSKNTTTPPARIPKLPLLYTEQRRRPGRRWTVMKGLKVEDNLLAQRQKSKEVTQKK